jgi:hypothetical protein
MARDGGPPSLNTAMLERNSKKKPPYLQRERLDNLGGPPSRAMTVLFGVRSRPLICSNGTRSTQKTDLACANPR